MLFFGSYNRDRIEDTGTFDCPACGESKAFQFFRTHRYFHIWFIPVSRLETVGEHVKCVECNSQFPVHVLRDQAEMVDSAFTASSPAGGSALDHFGNVVTLSDAAVVEISQRHAQGGYEHDVAVRVEIEDEHQRTCRIGFDYPEADGRDWIGDSKGITILVDRRDASSIHGSTIQYEDGIFRWSPS